MRLGGTSVTYATGRPSKDGLMFLHSLCRSLCTSQRHKGLRRCDLQVGDGGLLGNSVRHPPSGIFAARKLWLQVRHLSWK
jgi:hypothetical protein